MVAEQYRVMHEHLFAAIVEVLGTETVTAEIAAAWHEQPSGDSRTGALTVSALDLPAEADIYLCGGAGFLQSVRAQLTAAGVPLTRVHFELFSPDDWLLRRDTDRSGTAARCRGRHAGESAGLRSHSEHAASKRAAGAVVRTRPVRCRRWSAIVGTDRRLVVRPQRLCTPHKTLPGLWLHRPYPDSMPLANLGHQSNRPGRYSIPRPRKKESADIPGSHGTSLFPDRRKISRRISARRLGRNIWLRNRDRR
jgi:hypothetical protein